MNELIIVQFFIFCRIHLADKQLVLFGMNSCFEIVFGRNGGAYIGKAGLSNKYKGQYKGCEPFQHSQLNVQITFQKINFHYKILVGY